MPPDPGCHRSLVVFWSFLTAFLTERPTSLLWVSLICKARTAAVAAGRW